MKHEDLVLSASVTSSCLDCLRTDVAGLARYCQHHLCTTPAVHHAMLTGTRAQAAADAVAAALAALRGEFDEERERFQRTVYAQSVSFKDMHTSLHEAWEASRMKGDLSERLNAFGKQLALLERSTAERDDAQQQELEALRQEAAALESSHWEARGDALDHVRRLEEATEATRQYATTFALEQIDHALRLAKSVDKLEVHCGTQAATG